MLLIVLLTQKEKKKYMFLYGSSVFKVLIIHVAAVTTAENGRRALEFLGLGDDQNNTLESRVSNSKKREIILNILIRLTIGHYPLSKRINMGTSSVEMNQ